MATTKIWAVSDNLKRVLEYASNPDKTENRDLNDYQFKGLKNVIEYAADNLKTEKQFYVSGINCSPNNVLVQMISTKKAAHKEDGVKAGLVTLNWTVFKRTVTIENQEKR